MALTLSCHIINHGEDALTHWFEIELHDGGKILDGDFFRWAKATKRVLLNPQFDLDGNHIDPAIQVPTAIWEDREGNAFDYDEVMDIAARHFLRRQGILVKLEQWSPTGIRRISGTIVSKTDGRTLTARRIAMTGAIIEIDDATRTVTLRELKLHRGTVDTISTDFDGNIADSNFKDTTTTTAIIGGNIIASLRRRVFCRFPLAVIGAGADITNTDIKFNITFTSNLINEGRIQAYNVDGQADPSVDTGPTLYDRCKDDVTPYISLNPYSDATGIKTITIAADADIKAAVNTPDRFSLSFAYTTAEDDVSVNGTSLHLETIENSGTDEPKLIITHITLGIISGINRGLINHNFLINGGILIA